MQNTKNFSVFSTTLLYKHTLNHISLENPAKTSKHGVLAGFLFKCIKSVIQVKVITMLPWDLDHFLTVLLLLVHKQPCPLIFL